MTPDAALASRTVDAAALGERIHAARLAAGLTQAELAAGDATAAYVSRIEGGQRRPSPRLLETFAARMNVSVAELIGDAAPRLVDQRIALDHAELSLYGGDPDAALQAVDQIMASADDPETVREASYIRAGALESLGDLNGAIMALEDLAADPDPSVRWIRALIALCRCYKEQGDFQRAIEVGVRAAPVIERLGLAGLTESIQLTVSVAAAHTDLGDLNAALRMCDRAARDADAVKSPAAKASAYWNASIVESRRGAHGSALALARTALGLFEIGDDLRNLGRLRTQIAILELRRTPPDADAAQACLAQAERELDWSSASAQDKAEHALATARAQFVQGDLGDAEATATAALEMVDGSAPALAATAATLLGEIAARSGAKSKARGAFEAAIRELSGIGSDQQAARLWAELAVRLDDLGEPELALDAYRRSAAASGVRSAVWNTPAAV